jgi:uncharacterized repeat protein (TIGR02543 family)
MKKIKQLLPVCIFCVCFVALLFIAACGTKYTVTFDSDGGTEVAAQTIDKDSTVQKPEDPTKTGYIFAGWYSGDTEYDFTSGVTSDLTLTAKWNQKANQNFTVTFDYNNNGATQNVTSTVSEGNAVAKPADPTREGYTFAGWYDGTTAYDFTSKVTANKTLTAKWEVKNFTITYNYNDDTTANVTADVQEGTTATKPTDPTREGYTFAGWYDGTTAYDFTSKVVANKTLTAKWTQLFMLYNIAIDTNNVKVNYAINDTFTAEGLVVKATYNYIENGKTLSKEVAVELTDTNLQIDSSAFNAQAKGSYNIYVGYTQNGVTRYASYSVMVTSQISGVHGIELEKTVTSYNVAVKGETPVAIALDDLHVYTVSADGNKGEEITEGITYSYYLNNTEVQVADLTNKNAYKYQIWVSVPYTSGNETYNMTDFVVVTIIGNEITKMSLKSGTQVQAQSYTDSISSTWVFTANFSLTGEEEISLTTATKGTGENQYSLADFSTTAIGGHTAVITYYYAVGSDIYKYSCDVAYYISAATADGTYGAFVDVNVGTDDRFKDTATNVISATTLPNGTEVVPNMVYIYGDDVTATTQNKSGANGEAKLQGRVQFSTTKGITLYAAGPATITFYVMFGSTSDKQGAAYALMQGETVVATSEVVTNGSNYVTTTLSVPASGIYTIVTTRSTLNTFAFQISGRMIGVKESADIASLAINSNITAETAIGTSGTFTLVASSSGAVSVETKEATVGGVAFTQTINLKGSKNNASKADTRSIKLVITEDMVKNGSVTIVAYANHGGGAGSIRTLGLYAAGNNGSNYITSGAVDGAGAVVTLSVTAAGTYYLGSASSGMNIFALSLIYDTATTGEAA